MRQRERLGFGVCLLAQLFYITRVVARVFFVCLRSYLALQWYLLLLLLKVVLKFSLSLATGAMVLALSLLCLRLELDVIDPISAPSKVGSLLRILLTHDRLR